MEPIAIVFPGQGTQRPGMGADFHERFSDARDAFSEASDALDLDLRAICFGPDPRLALTEFTQPAILATEVAMLRSVRAAWGVEASWYGGHSLGEYTALVAAGALPFADALRAVRERGRRMQEAVAAGHGAMAAIIRDGLDPDAIRACLGGLVVDVANHNGPDQVVISGAAADVDRAIEQLGADPAGAGARFRKLDVSAPFHCRLMAGIEPGFREVLAALPWEAGNATSVASNFTGGWHTSDRRAVVDALVRQISGTVRWLEDMRAIAATGARIVEIGPNRPLMGFFRSIGVDVVPVHNVLAAERTFAPK